MMTEWDEFNNAGFFWLDSYPFFARDFQLDLFLPQFLPLAVVPAEGSPLLLDLLLPGRLTRDMGIKFFVDTGVGGDIAFFQNLLEAFHRFIQVGQTRQWWESEDTENRLKTPERGDQRMSSSP